MATEFKLPDLGEGIESAEVGSILIKEGDTVEVDQIVAELETEKAVIPLQASAAGRIVSIRVKPGDKVPVGAVLFTYEPSESAPKGASAPSAEPPAASAPSPKPKERTKEPPAPQPTAVRAPDTDGNGAAKQSKEPPAVAPAKKEAVAQPREDVAVMPAPASPATRRLARELGVDLHKVVGSGPGGRVTAEDVQTYVRHITSGSTAAAPGRIAVPPLPDFSQYGPVERQPLNKVARSAAQNLSLAWQVVPHVTQHELADITELEQGRKKYMQALGESSPKITMTVLAIKAAVAALKAFPHFNASFDHITDEIVLKQYYHIGIAVDTEHGLLVPVVKNADKKSIVELAAEVTELAGRARGRKIDLADLKGGTFTISNLGGIGGTAFTPIVNYPQVAILGMSRARAQIELEGGQPRSRLQLPLSLSYDHRVINGADGARFMAKLAGLLSDPIELLIEG